MEQKTIFEQLGGTYSQQGDYMLPNLTLPDTKEYVIGKYGHMRQRYLKKHRPILYRAPLNIHCCSEVRIFYSRFLSKRRGHTDV